jgi:protein ImuB
VLWLSIFLPELSLQSHCRGVLGQVRDLPLVISDGIATRPHVHAANACARSAGIAPMMPVTSAQARTTDLIVVPREIAKERQSLRQIATWLSQFTPMTCLEAAGASLEVSTSLKLFGGIGTLAKRIRTGIGALQFHATLGIAPTPLAAYLLAKASHHAAGVRMCRDATQLQARLADIPLALFAWPVDILQPLTALGFTRVKDLLMQPRAGLQRRFGDLVLGDLDRALGLIPDPRQPHQVPESFKSHIDLLFETADIERICIPVQILLNEMEGFLHARGAAVNEILIELKHDRVAKTDHRFGARNAIRKAGDWLRLVRERLAAQPLPDAVTDITLSTARLVPFQLKTESWLPTREIETEQWQTLLERIASRLGKECVFSVQICSDHRPERAWQTGIEGGKHKAQTTMDKPRPLLLLAEPKALVTMSGVPQHHGALSLLAGGERIETGWWDGFPVARDYFVARNPQQEICWIFCDYRQGRRWYLHGYFS